MVVRTRRLFGAWGQWQTICLLATFVILATVLGACGKKPDRVDPPPGVTVDHFPHVYPDVATDPKP